MKQSETNTSDHMDTDTNSTHRNKRTDDKEQWRRRLSQPAPPSKNLLVHICQSPSIFIFLLIIGSVPGKPVDARLAGHVRIARSVLVLQVFMGWYFSNACPINKLIPHYSIVAGIVGLLLLTLICITQFITRVFGRNLADDAVDRGNPNRATMLVGCGICSIMCINLSMFIFLLGWSVAGLIWTMEVWHRVQHRNAERRDYCHPMLYLFTVSVLLVTMIFKTLFFAVVCQKTCTKMTMARRRDTVTSDEA